MALVVDVVAEGLRLHFRRREPLLGELGGGALEELLLGVLGDDLVHLPGPRVGDRRPDQRHVRVRVPAEEVELGALVRDLHLQVVLPRFRLVCLGRLLVIAFVIVVVVFLLLLILVGTLFLILINTLLLVLIGALFLIFVVVVVAVLVGDFGLYDFCWDALFGCYDLLDDLDILVVPVPFCPSGGGLLLDNGELLLCVGCCGVVVGLVELLDQEVLTVLLVLLLAGLDRTVLVYRKRKERERRKEKKVLHFHCLSSSLSLPLFSSLLFFFFPFHRFNYFLIFEPVDVSLIFALSSLHFFFGHPFHIIHHHCLVTNTETIIKSSVG